MPSSKKSLLAITVESVEALHKLDEAPSSTGRHKKIARCHNEFMAACFASFDLDPDLPTHLHVMEAWWQTALDLYHFDAQMRRGYDPGYRG